MHFYALPFLQEINEEKQPNLTPSKQRLQKLRFLQKLGCKKPCLDQARLSSLVNIKVGTAPTTLGLLIIYQAMKA